MWPHRALQCESIAGNYRVRPSEILRQPILFSNITFRLSITCYVAAVSNISPKSKPTNYKGKYPAIVTPCLRPTEEKAHKMKKPFRTNSHQRNSQGDLWSQLSCGRSSDIKVLQCGSVSYLQPSHTTRYCPTVFYVFGTFCEKRIRQFYVIIFPQPLLAFMSVRACSIEMDESLRSADVA